MIYLLHFHSRLSGHAQHYMGSTDNLARRLEMHLNGHGARIMAAVAEAGITWEVARTWEGGRMLERHLKGRPIGSMKLRAFCPVCAPMPRVNQWAGGGKLINQRILKRQFAR